MVNLITNLISNALLLVGGYGTSTMCFGFLHEVEIPKELKENNM